MFDLTIENRDGILVVDSRDVAAMVGKRHSDLLESIRNYAKIINSSLNEKFRSMDFFIKSSYKDNIGRILPCYVLTRKGCDMVANKMTGEKGVLFTAAYITKFDEMEMKLKKPLSKTDWLIESALQMKKIEEKQSIQDDRIKNLEGKINIINDKEYTIMGYANINNINLDNKTAVALGRKASRLSRENGYYIGSASHPVFGRVNTYHIDILEIVFDEMFEEFT